MRKFYLVIGAEIIMILILAFLGSCQSKDGFRETGSGLVYKNEREGDGENPQEGDIMLLNISYSDAEGKELFTTQDGIPVSMIYDARMDSIDGGVEEGIRMMKAGDSVVLKFPAENLFEKTFNSQLPPEIERGSLLTMCIGMDKVMNEAEFQEYQVELRAKVEAKEKEKGAEQLKIDIDILDKYFAENNIEAQVHESGVRYVIHSKGNGEFPQNGQNVQVHYAGKFLDGQLFDTSIQSVAEENNAYNPGRPYSPFTFALGAGQVIQGWDIGIGLLDKGAKATLYIPSGLAYGPRDGGRIPPNSVLMFDVELVDF